MPDPADSRQAREGLVLIAQDWCRRRVWAGDPVLGPVLREGLELAASGAPRLAADFPELMREIGPPAAYRIRVQAIALAASEEAQAAADEARWITTAQAATVLGITANGVRDLLRRGRLDGRRRECGWRVDVASVRSRRRNGRRLAALR
jgi:hypothetical protein